MTLPTHPHDLQGRSDNSSEEIRPWRCRQLVAVGFPRDLADAVAADPRFDLHALLELVDRGCPPELAVRIMSPVDREWAQ